MLSVETNFFYLLPLCTSALSRERKVVVETKMKADNDNQGRAALIDSICRLSWYVPRCVLDDLIEDVTQPSPEENSQSVVSSMPVNCGVTDSPRKKIDKKSAKAAAAAAAAPSTFLDPFSEDSDVDSVSKPASASFLDPFPYDSDGELGMRQSGQFHVGANKFPMVLPFASQHKCALLVITISGFTELPQLLDVESLSKVSNRASYHVFLCTLFASWPSTESCH